LWAIKESFQGVWEFASVHWAGRYLDGWLKRALRSRQEPIQRVARSMRAIVG
jgi:hypothetical protein